MEKLKRKFSAPFVKRKNSKQSSESEIDNEASTSMKNGSSSSEKGYKGRVFHQAPYLIGNKAKSQSSPNLSHPENRKFSGGGLDAQKEEREPDLNPGSSIRGQSSPNLSMPKGKKATKSGELAPIEDNEANRKSISRGISSPVLFGKHKSPLGHSSREEPDDNKKKKKGVSSPNLFQNSSKGKELVPFGKEAAPVETAARKRGSSVDASARLNKSDNVSSKGKELVLYQKRPSLGHSSRDGAATSDKSSRENKRKHSKDDVKSKKSESSSKKKRSN